jgi:aspartyl-tRNA(Asn)/glutamyl-tRNA(Gln) amidotransferase subunit C
MTNVDIKHLANLARLELTDEEIAAYEAEFADILAYIDQLKEVDISDDKPIEGAVVRNVFREDENPVESGINKDTLLDEAPNTHNGYVKVQKILDTNNNA